MNPRMKQVGWWLAAAWIVARSVQGALLSNSGFETGNLSSWSTFGQGWRTGSGADAYSGSVGLVDDILTSDSDNWRGIYQNVAIIPGDLYSGGVWIRAVSIGSSESYFELQFLDETGSVLSQYQSSRVTADQAFTYAGVGPVLAPAGAVTASVRGIVYMPSVPADSDFHVFDDFEFADVTPSHVDLLNHGFESGDFTGWSSFGQGWRISTGTDAYSWTYGAVDDVLTSDWDDWRGLYQNVPVTAGLTYCAGVYIRAVSVEATKSWLEIQWLNSSGGIISQLASSNVVADQPFQLVKLHDIVAPNGAVTASVRCIVNRYGTPANADFHIFDEAYFLRPVDLTVSITASTTNVVGTKETVTYTLVVSNRSSSMSGTYFVTNFLPTNLTFVSASSGGVYNASAVSWGLFGLLGGATTTLTVTAVQPYYTGSTQRFTNAVSAWVTSDIGDPVSSNNHAAVETTTWGIPFLTTTAMLILAGIIVYAFYRRSQAPSRVHT